MNTPHSPYTLFVGNIFRDEAVERHFGLAASANYWRRGLVSGLSSAGLRMKVIGHRNEQAWPHGKLFPNEKDTLDPTFDSTLVPWCNLPGIRYPLLGRMHVHAFQRMVRKHGLPKQILTYNAYPWHVPVARNAQKHGVRWICITLDYDHGPDGWENFRREAGMADGHVFLSHWCVENCPLPTPVFHLDGGYDTWYGDADLSDQRHDGKTVVLYSGKFTGYGGNDLLLDLFHASRGSNLEFWLTGKARDDFKTTLESDFPEVKYFGFVSDEDLHSLSLKADVFLNPRPGSNKVNYGIFPSKILRYLAYGKPVISTWTPGLAPEYRPHLFVADDESASALLECIATTADLTNQEKENYRHEVRAFLDAKKSWRTQGRRLKDWIESEFMEFNS
jgi:glycosyltransferase involved in cell wall biosynthesis